MREIRFRAWDKKDQKWWDNYPTGDALVLTHDKATGIVFQQYTGLKDKNGKEIYEGDIMGCKNSLKYKKDGTLDKRLRAGEPEWVDVQEVRWGVHPDFSSGWDYESGNFVGWNVNPDELDRKWSEPLVVIGNVWENPELLEKKQ